jgi:hypothetical protein
MEDLKSKTLQVLGSQVNSKKLLINQEREKLIEEMDEAERGIRAYKSERVDSIRNKKLMQRSYGNFLNKQVHERLNSEYTGDVMTSNELLMNKEMLFGSGTPKKRSIF